MKVSLLCPATDQRWETMTDTMDADLFHSRPWILALMDAYQFKVEAAVVESQTGSLVGGIAYSRIDDLLGDRLVSLPFSDACDPLPKNGKTWELLFRQLSSFGVPIYLRCLDNENAPHDGRFTTAKCARWHHVPVLAEPEAQLRSICPAARRAIRRARREGVCIRTLGKAEGTKEFHRLHVALRKNKYRLLAQPVAFFQSIARRFSAVDGWYPLGAFHEGRLIAVTIYLRWRNRLYYKFNASAPESLYLRPNNLLVWEGLELARSLGCTELDFGPSDDNQRGLIRFKRQFGATERELRFLQYVPPGWRDERSEEMRDLLQNLTGLFTSPDLPNSLADKAGEILYPLFA